MTSIENDYFTGSVFMDFSKALNIKDRQIILNEIYNYQLVQELRVL